jgi:hypothetical protein
MAKAPFGQKDHAPRAAVLPRVAPHGLQQFRNAPIQLSLLDPVDLQHLTRLRVPADNLNVALAHAEYSCDEVYDGVIRLSALGSSSDLNFDRIAEFPCDAISRGAGDNFDVESRHRDRSHF